MGEGEGVGVGVGVRTAPDAPDAPAPAPRPRPARPLPARRSSSYFPEDACPPLTSLTRCPEKTRLTRKARAPPGTAALLASPSASGAPVASLVTPK